MCNIIYTVCAKILHVAAQEITTEEFHYCNRTASVPRHSCGEENTYLVSDVYTCEIS